MGDRITKASDSSRDKGTLQKGIELYYSGSFADGYPVICGSLKTVESKISCWGPVALFVHLACGLIFFLQLMCLLTPISAIDFH